MSLENIEKYLNCEFPSIYKKFLEKFNENAIIVFHCNFEVINRSNWTFVGQKKLIEPIYSKSKQDGLKWWQILTYYWRDSLNKKIGKKNSLNNLDEASVRNMVAVAYDEGDILYINVLKDFQIGVYLNDVNEVFDLNFTLEDIFSKMKVIYSD
ncbi:hypothetical protein F966_02812 [Acinetobacter higginsii]|uniref:Knr4/Smi1-like domain-containing protein n=1 Tax=Acinetobacter higginsii TaxID=70347 RepID=N8W9D9_9GAMM|nr:hypothetical protein [Acinetobacter higginsii]ENV08697.1 hypothetical protein F966_02812 [Acinetobacter higginsii]